ASIGDEHIDAAPFCDDFGDHRVYGIPVGHVELDADRRTAVSVDLGDCASGAHVAGLGLEFFVGPEVQICDGDLGAEPGEPARVGAAEAAGCAGDDRNLTVEPTHQMLLFPRPYHASRWRAQTA